MPSADMKSLVATLTPRQREVLRLISLGCTVAEIADILGTATSTIDNHRTALMRHLGIGKSVLLTRIAIKYRVSKVDETLTLSEKRKRGRGKDGWN